MVSIKKSILLLFFLAITLIVSGTNYYISSSGNDAANGLSESSSWKTITKVNSAFSTFKPGDMILFKRGDVFDGSIIVSVAGLSGSPITIGAYGTGADPVINGLSTISGWTNYGKGIYYKDIACESVPNMVTVNGVNTPIGRSPNTGWLTIDTHSPGSHSSFTDAVLSNYPNLTGADVVVKGSLCLLDRVKILSHSSQTLTFSNLTEEITDEAGYFIQNHLSTLDVFGEWCYTGGRFYMFFGTVDPTTKVIKVSVRDNLISINSKNYITVEHLNIIGSNSSGININGSAYSVVQNCNFDFNGNHAIRATSGNNGFARVESNVINHTNNLAIEFNSSSPNVKILSNTVSNTGMIEGMGDMGFPSYSGIRCTGGGNIISYNRVVNSGYIGIASQGGNWEVSYNYVDNFGIVKDDGGGIYSWKDQNISGKTIKYNIVLHGQGNPAGWIESKPEATHGIYLDETYGVTISNNTIAYNYAGYGLFLHMSNNDVVESNTFFDNSISMRALSGTGLVRSLDVHKNIFFAKTATQITLSAVTKFEESDIALFGSFDYNYYVRPLSDDNYIDKWYNAWSTSDFKLNLKEWRDFLGNDTHSGSTPISLNDVNKIRFEYNETRSNKIVSLDAGYIDVFGTKYSGSITLLPFTALVLMVDPNPAAVPVAPVNSNSSIEDANPSVLVMNYDLSLGSTIPAASAYSVMVNSIARAVTKVAVSGTKVQLTLATPVVFGDVVTVTYTKPAVNPVQTSAGGQAISITARSVTNNVAAIKPVYINSSVENGTPSVINMTYNNTLANIVPAASSFTVLVSSVNRTVRTVVVSGTSVKLTLSSPIVSGNVVTVSYTKPAVNPIQTSAGGQAISITAQSVTNNVAVINPVYINSSVENGAPSVINMTYNNTLANIVPATSSFTVLVNSVNRTVRSVVVSGTSVKLTLSSPVVSGDVITVSYTKPSVNPLQTAAGIQAVTISAQAVTNRIAVVTGTPVYLASTVDNATPALLKIDYDLALSNVSPAVSSFSVTVNSLAIKVQSVEVSGASVKLTLEYEVLYGDVVTVAYTKPTSNPLQSTTGLIVASMSGQEVKNKVDPNGPVYLNSSIENATPDILKINFDEIVETSVPATSSFIVMVNGVKASITSVSISGNTVTLTMASPVVSGDIVNVSYIKPSINELKKATGATAVSFSSPQPVTNNCTNLPGTTLKKGYITVYPNPAREYINITILETSMESQLLRISDLSGNLFLESQVNTGTSNKVPINLKSGIYIVQIVSGTIINFVQKLIVI